MIRINQIKLNIKDDFDLIYKKIARILNININQINQNNIRILRKSIDLRDKNNILYVYNVAILLDNEKDIIKNIKNQNVTIYDDKIISYSKQNFDINEKNRPIIIGFGPAGIFCAYILALRGLKPIILERGKSYKERYDDVYKFLNNGVLNNNSNISFGEGGAGTFSDGKLYTGNADKDGYINYILNVLVKFGAKQSILYDSNPHIGTDLLKNIITNIKNEIIKLGGEIKYNYKWTFNDNINNYYNSPKILCIGNSSRDTFYDLYKNGFDLKPKSIAMGFRVAHKQDIINSFQYKNNNTHKILGNASYKLIHKYKNKTIYSFCTCPGGYIINSSNFDYLTSINGMSYSDRANEYINSAIVINFDVNDYDINNPFTIMDIQNKLEEKAFDLAEWEIPYCFLGDFYDINYKCKNQNIDKCFLGNHKYNKGLVHIFDDIDLKFNFNEIFLNAMEHFDSIIPSFGSYNTVIAGVETRTSSPVKINRNDDFMSNIENYFPCGEGLGYGGGIMSSAVDGIKVANKIIKRYENGRYK